MSHFRPISLHNVCYKSIANVLANRLKVIIPYIILFNQSALVPQRQITYIFFVAYEILRTLKRWKSQKSREISMTIKLDTSEAYGKVK